MLDHSPTPRIRPNYKLVLVLLVVFTILEVTASYLAGRIKIPLLLALAAVKASLVVLYFMHLRYDSRLFAILFFIGAILIFPLLLVMLLVMPGL